MLDVWRAKQADARHFRDVAERRVENLRLRLDRVDEAFIQERAIDKASYDRQRDKLREDWALAEMEFHDLRLDELDVEGIVAFAEHVLTNAARLWTEAPLDQKQRLQQVLFPEGLRFDGEKFGTAVTSLAFSQLPENVTVGVKSSVASPTGF